MTFHRNIISQNRGAYYNEKNGTIAVKRGIEIAGTENKGKTIDSKGYGIFYEGETNGIAVKSLPPNGKIVKTVYSVRYAPKIEVTPYTSARKAVKITVSSEGKTPKYKANYKNEIIKLKKGDMIFAGTVDELGGLYTECSSATVDLTKGSLLLVTATKGTTVSLAKYLSTQAETVIIWKAGTSKVPSTAKQIYKLAPCFTMSEAISTGTNGKITLDNKY